MKREYSFDQPNLYTIVVKGWLDRKWANWFDGLEITYEGDNTRLQGILDQSALYGILSELGDLGLPLLSVSAVACKKGKTKRTPHPITQR